LADTDDDLLAVVAHGLLNSIAAIGLNAALLKRSANLSDEERQLLEGIELQTRHVGAVLVDLTRAGGSELLSHLDALQRTPTRQRLPGD
jgi:signal transduction histidine kinase